MTFKRSDLIKTGSFIDGAWDKSASVFFDVTNPADGSVIATLGDAKADSMRRAVDAASNALGPWSSTLARDRARLLRGWFDLIVQHIDDLALIMMMEQGKPLPEARAEIRYGASFVEWYAEEAKRVYGDLIPTHKEEARILVMKQPIGVVGAITPWNFPSAMITRKVAPALAAGCSVVIKPSEETPLSALALMQLAHEAGFPNGVINCVVGRDAPSLGRVLCDDPRVCKISFTGSTEIGRTLMAQCAPQVKKLSLELGGNAAFMVFADADLDRAVQGLMASKFRNAGQTCVCANRIFVERSIHAPFLEKLSRAVATLNLGHGTADGVTLGPLINHKALTKVIDIVEDARLHGAAVMMGGKPAPIHGDLFYEPTILDAVTSTMRVMREEIFGPVLPISVFDTEAQVITLANATDYGLAAYFYTSDLARAFRVAEALEAGIVAVNEGVFSTETAPFGGVKQSGLGREGGYHGIEEYLVTKYVLMGGITGPLK